MALAFYVDKPDSLSSVFAAHDEYLAVFSYFLNGGEVPADIILTPDSNHYSAPYCFLPKKYDKRTGRVAAGFIVFTCLVPWLNGNPKAEQGETAHKKAKDWMGNRSRLSDNFTPHLGSVENFQESLNVGEEEVYTFTADGYYPTKEDVSQALEDKAVAMICKITGWEVPNDWRALRERKTDLHDIPICNLNDWDAGKYTNKQNIPQKDENNGGNGDAVLTHEC